MLGNLSQLDSLPQISLRDLSNKHGPVMLLHLGRPPTVVTSSAEAARVVLKNHDLDCCSRPPLVGLGRLSYNYLDISFSPYGDYWRELRKLCVVELLVRRGYNRIDPFVRKRFLCSSIQYHRPLALAVLLLTLQKADLEKWFMKPQLFWELFSASEYFPYVGWIVDRRTSLHGRIERIFHKLDAFFKQVIDDHLNPELSRDDDHEDILDVLLRLYKDGVEFGGTPLTKDSIKAVVMVSC
ncbi:hypothetical protein PTKIN_Ptkin02bG0075100 [Pterospermum kingtungense]